MFARFLTKLESGFAASFPGAIDPMSVIEFTASIPSERNHSLRTCHFAIHCSICFSVTAFMSYHSTDNFRDLRFLLEFVTVCTGNDVLPFPFMNRNVII